MNSDQVFGWRRLMTQGAPMAAGAGEEVVPASEYRALKTQVRELQRLLDKKTMENEIRKEAVSKAGCDKGALAHDLVTGGWTVTVDALGASRTST